MDVWFGDDSLIVYDDVFYILAYNSLELIKYNENVLFE